MEWVVNHLKKAKPPADQRGIVMADVMGLGKTVSKLSLILLDFFPNYSCISHIFSNHFSGSMRGSVYAPKCHGAGSRKTSKANFDCQSKWSSGSSVVRNTHQGKRRARKDFSIPNQIPNATGATTLFLPLQSIRLANRNSPLLWPTQNRTNPSFKMLTLPQCSQKSAQMPSKSIPRRAGKGLELVQGRTTKQPKQQ